MTKRYCIGNTHFDPVWLWTWDEAMASVRATFRAALARMDEDPDFVYSFATPPVFEWIKAVEPELFEAIRQRVVEGRWELGEGWWLQPDCYSASGESYVRQGLYGQRWLAENFGRQADTVFNIDSFGHSPMLPQILAGCGIRYYCFTRPEARHVPLDSPLFWWESPDGSRVLTYRAEGCYDKNMPARLTRPPTGGNIVEKTGYDPDEMVVYGVTDHGGAPTKAALAAIRENPDAFCSSLTRYFTDHLDCSVIQRREFVTGDFGVYANLPQIKAMVRRGEISLLNAEKAAVLADLAGCSMPDSRALLRKAWQDVLFNQFHDIIGGACIRDAYDDAFAGLGRAITTGREQMHFALQRITAGLRMPGDEWNLAVWNLNTTAYDGYMEAEVQWAHEFDWYDGAIELEDTDGKRYPCQILREKSVIPRFRSRFLFRAEIPAMGYRLFHVCRTGETIRKPAGDPGRIETDRLTVTLENGCITSVQDKTGRQLCDSVFTPAAYRDDGDTWAFNIPAYDGTPLRWELQSTEVKEAGPLRTSIRSHFRLGLSTLTLYYTVYHDTDAIDLRWSCCWNDRYKAVKLLFAVSDPDHLAAVPYGSVRRNANGADVPLGPWLRYDGCTLLCDGSFAYNLRDGQLGVTLLRSPIYGDLRIGPIDTDDDYDILSQGITEGRMRLCFAPLSEAEASAAAERFVNPPIVIDEAWHDGIPCGHHGYCTVDARSTCLTVVKHAEDGGGTILRLAEYCGREDRVTLRLGTLVYAAEMRPYEIKTLLLEGGEIREVSMLER